jgi:DUF4097 and DUF4098 domain-containing protein YvlB
MNSRWARNTVAVILVAIGIIALFQNQFGVKSKAYAHTLRLDDHMREISIVSDSLALEVHFIADGEGSNSIQVEGRAKPEVINLIKAAQVENGKLNLRFKEKWRWGLFNFSGWNEKQVITVSLTDEAMQSLELLKVTNDSGSVMVDGAEALESVIQSDSGSIRLGAMQGDTLTVKSDSGSIKLDSYAGSSLSIASDSGSIHTGTVRADLKASTDSGSITIGQLTGASEVKSDSGSIRIVKDDETGADISNDSGSVRITIPASYSGSYDLKSDSGSIRHPDPVGTSGELIKVRTDSGSIRIVQD